MTNHRRIATLQAWLGGPRAKPVQAMAGWVLRVLMPLPSAVQCFVPDGWGARQNAVARSVDPLACTNVGVPVVKRQLGRGSSSRARSQNCPAAWIGHYLLHSMTAVFWLLVAPVAVAQVPPALVATDPDMGRVVVDVGGVLKTIELGSTVEEGELRLERVATDSAEFFDREGEQRWLVFIDGRAPLSWRLVPPEMAPVRELRLQLVKPVRDDAAPPQGDDS